MIDFVLSNWIAIAAAYGIIYAVYVVYALFAIRFGEQRRVTTWDFKEVCGEAVIGPILLPCRMVGNALSVVKVSLLAMVNAGLPDEPRKGHNE